MIKITGKRGEGVGLIVSLAIKSVLNLNNENIVFLVDDTSEFIPLGRELSAQFIEIQGDASKYDKHSHIAALDNLDFSKRFFIFSTYNYDNDTLCKQKLFAQLDEIKTRSDKEIFIFCKSTYY